MKKPVMPLLASLIVITAFTVCSKKKYPVTVTVEDGVQVTTNPEIPKQGEYRLDLETEWTVPVSQDSAMAGLPHDVQAEEGRVYVSDWKTGLMAVLDDAGRHLNTIPRDTARGFTIPFYFGLDADRTVWVLESALSRISGWKPDGIRAVSFELPGKTWTRMEVLPRGGFVVSRETYTENGLTLSLLRFNDRGETLHDYGYFRVAQPLLIEHEGRRMMLGASPYAPTTVWRIHGENLYAGYSETYRIRVYDGAGELLFKFGRDFRPLENPYRGAVGQPDRLPAFSKIWELDRKGKLWIEVYTDSTEREFVYDVFSPGGLYEKRVTSPERVFAFCGDGVYGIVRLENGERMIRKSRPVLRPRKDRAGTE